MGSANSRIEVQMNRLAFLKAYLWAFGMLAFLWWPVSHWVYPGWYHTFLGFESFEPAYVKVIGTLAVMPVVGILFAAVNPLRNRDLLIALIVLSILMMGTYAHLIVTQQFPAGEYLNVAVLGANTLALGLLYPWKQANARISGGIK